MNWGQLVGTKTFWAGIGKVIAGVGGIVMGGLTCAATVGGGAGVGVPMIMAGVYGIIDGVGTISQRDAVVTVQNTIANPVNVSGVPKDVINAAVAQFGKIIADHAAPGPQK
jgi:hypothetical protein